MKKITSEQALQAGKTFSEKFSHIAGRSVGLGRDENGEFCVAVLLSYRPTKEELAAWPKECDGVAVKYETLGF